VKRVQRGAKKTHGKLFLSFGAVDYVCSGTAVNSPSDSLVWTAGHCVYEPGALGGKADNVQFVPAYKNGKAPFGEWPADEVNATSQWKNGGVICLPGISFGGCGDVSHDLGAVSVDRLDGRELHDVVGARGIDFNGPPDRTYKAYGYPQEPPFDGEHMYRCKSSLQGRDNSAGEPKPMRIRCDMTGGSSGGGWVTGGKVASVVSYGYSDEPNNLYGPYQGNAAKSLYEALDDG
jgi:V8-like Glu-specific endopeptidase